MGVTENRSLSYRMLYCIVLSFAGFGMLRFGQGLADAFRSQVVRAVQIPCDHWRVERMYNITATDYEKMVQQKPTDDGHTDANNEIILP